MRILAIILFLSMCFSCSYNKNKNDTSTLVKQWIGKKVIFPNNLIFYRFDGKQVDYEIPLSKYKIIRYVDSLECASCELRLTEWKNFMDELHAYSNDVIPVLFFFSFNSEEGLNELRSYMNVEEFPFPFSIDSLNCMDQLNKFPNQKYFHTILLNEKNETVLIGDPVLNFKVRKLYEGIFFDKNKKQHSLKLTDVIINKKEEDMKNFDWKEAQTTIFSLQNTGKYPLTIQDITTSCGCTSAEYSKEPAASGKSLDIKVTYKADHPEHFNKTVSVYCNATASPIQLKIRGEAR